MFLWGLFRSSAVFQCLLTPPDFSRKTGAGVSHRVLSWGLMYCCHWQHGNLCIFVLGRELMNGGNLGWKRQWQAHASGMCRMLDTKGRMLIKTLFMNKIWNTGVSSVWQGALYLVSHRWDRRWEWTKSVSLYSSAPSWTHRNCFHPLGIPSCQAFPPSWAHPRSLCHQLLKQVLGTPQQYCLGAVGIRPPSTACSLMQL